MSLSSLSHELHGFALYISAMQAQNAMELGTVVLKLVSESRKDRKIGLSSCKHFLHLAVTMLDVLFLAPWQLTKHSWRKPWRPSFDGGSTYLCLRQ
jgi:hypothetical protein